MPLPYEERFKDRVGKLVAVGEYKPEEEVPLADIVLIKYSREAKLLSGESAGKIVLWDVPGIGAWKELPLPATRARVYVEKRAYRVRWIPYRTVAELAELEILIGGRFLVGRLQESGATLLVADRRFREAWAYGPRGKRRLLCSKRLGSP